MMNKDILNQKKITVEEAVTKTKSNDVIFCAAALCEPQTFLNHLHTIRDQVENVTVITGILGGNYPYYSDPGMYGYFQNYAWMYTAGSRAAHAHHTVSYLPVEIHSLGSFIPYAYPPNVFVGSVAPMDAHGYFSLSLSNVYERDCIDHADLVILEVNPQLPRTFGDNQVHISEVDFIIDSRYDIPVIEPPVVGKEDMLIGEFVADLIEDGSTVQLGVGNIPAAVAQCLKDKKDLGIHSGMINDSVLDLYEAGVITNRRKSLWKDRFVTCLAAGTPRFLAFMDDNPAFVFERGCVVNNASIIGQNDKMISINTINQMDLTGQCCAESIGPRLYSGTTGHKEWVSGPAWSKGGKSILAFHSAIKNGTISRIVPWLDEGSIVTTTRVDVHYVVTEYGVANLKGRSIKDRVQALIGIAHPNWRDYLKHEADKKQIW